MTLLAEDVSRREVHRKWIDELLPTGMVLRIESEATVHLVGDMRWLKSGPVFFEAFGDNDRDVRALTIDTIVRTDPDRALLLRERAVIGIVSSIERAGLEDPDDFRIAWQLWQQVAPMRQREIARCFDRFGPAQDELGEAGTND